MVGLNPSILTYTFPPQFFTLMTTTYQTNITDQTYNGWTNYETWNVALWINNTENLYHLAMECGDYETFVELVGNATTGDGVKFNDPRVNVIQINSDVFDLWLTLKISSPGGMTINYPPTVLYSFPFIMTKEVLISMLRQGNTGTEILSILDAITSDTVSEEQEGNMPTLDVIEFW